MKKCLILFMMIMISSVALWAEYTGVGLFEKIDGIADLESDAYYVFYGINGGSKGAMTNTISSGKLGNTAVTVAANKIVDPSPAIVWFVTENPAGEYTIYNEAEGKYAELTGNSTSGFALSAASTHTYTVSDNGAKGLFFETNSAANNKRGISIFKTDWRPYIKTGAYTLELYKLNDSGEPIPLNANFTTDFVTGIMPLTINFESTVIGGTEPYSYAWDFNNDGTIDATTANPSFEYTTDGTYSVKLTVTDDGGTESTELKTDYIIVLAGAPAGELVANGDFEEWDNPTTPTGWTYLQNINQESSIVHNGSYSAKHTAAGTKKFSQDITGIVPGETYTISYWYLDNDSVARSRSWSFWLTGTSTIDVHQPELRPNDYSVDNPAWQHFTYDLVAPAGADGFKFEIRTYGDSGDIYFDDFSVKLYDPSTPTPPTITNVVHIPSTNITSSTTVSVSATVTPGSESIFGVELLWGIASGVLTETAIDMSISTNNLYTTDSNIPAQAEGTTVYYQIYVLDNNTDATTSSEYSYTVTDPLPSAVDPAVGTLYISEVSAGKGTDTNYMELYNNSDNVLSLNNIKLVRLSATDSEEGQFLLNDSDYLGDRTILPHNYIIIARNADRLAFESAFGTGFTLPEGVTFLKGKYDDMYFGAGNARRWQLVLDTGSKEVITIDDTLVPVGGVNNTSYQDSPGHWTTESSANSTPGAPHDDQTLPVTLSSFMAVQTAENFAEITWTTESEASLTGYHVYRNESNEQETAYRISNSLIVSLNTNNSNHYSYLDNEVEMNTTYYYWLQINEFDGSTSFYGPYEIRINDDYATPEIVIPTKTTLKNVYPNPFNPSTSVSFYMEQAENVKINVYNVRGQLISNITKDNFTEGFHNVVWNGKDTKGNDCASGIYFFRMETKNNVQTLKGILMK